MVHLDRPVIATTASAAVIAVVAGAVFTAPTADGDVFAFSPEPPGFPFGSTPAAIALGGLVALVVLAVSRRVVAAVAAVGVGALILLVAALIDAPPALGTIGAGATLGGIIALAPVSGTRPTLTAVVGGFVIGHLAIPALHDLRRNEPSGPRRYADYLPADGSYTTFAGDRVLVVGAVLVVLAVITLAIAIRGTGRDPLDRPTTVPLAISTASLVAGALVFWWFTRFISRSLTDSTGLHTFLGGYVVVALLVIVAVVTPSRRGIIWLAAVAVVAAHGADGASADGTTVAVVIAALVALGVGGATLASRRTTARRVSSLVVGSLVVLVLLTATQFLRGEATEVIPAAAGLFVVPIALGIAMVAAVRGSIAPHGSTVIGAVIALPLLARVSGTSVGWTAYTPLTDDRGFNGFGGMSYTAATTTGVVSAVVTTAVCVLAALRIVRRPEVRAADQ